MRRYLMGLMAAFALIGLVDQETAQAARNRGAAREARNQESPLKAGSTASALVVSALDKEVAGDQKARSAYLRQALNRDPDLPSAH